MDEHVNIRGRRILVVQEDFIDEMDIALEVNTGARCGTLDITDQTLAVLQESDIGAAIFDKDLDPEKSAQIADALVELGIPFVFVKADEVLALPARLLEFSLTESSLELQVIAHQLLGRPTYH